ncbi:MAG: outer membrane lipoprotein chaperone LolA [Burkholderiaceae bacterium]|nr:outer membrane lipoprotein chaperone LolA [Burkholderiaceae bacterium]
MTRLRAFGASAGRPAVAGTAKAGALALLLTVASLAARADSLEQLRQFVAQTGSARGDFSQTTEAAGKQASQTSRGSFEFSRPGRFRWVYAEPYQQTIVSDGSSLYVYDPELNQVTVKKLKGAIPASPASILFGSNDLERDFQVTSDGEQDGVDWIAAKPRSQDSSFERIRIGFQGALPVRMELVDSFGHVTQLRFSGLQRNPRIDPSRFRFEPPKGADVLQEQ